MNLDPEGYWNNAQNVKKNEPLACPVERGVMPLDSRIAKIHANRVLKITADIDHLRNRPDCELIKDELDKAVEWLFKAVDTLEA